MPFDRTSRDGGFSPVAPLSTARGQRVFIASPASSRVAIHGYMKECIEDEDEQNDKKAAWTLLRF